LKGFNPWLLQNSLPNEEKKVYEFRIPKNTKFDYSSYLTDLKSASGDYSSAAENAIPEDVQPNDTAAMATANVVTEPKLIYHVVKEGETLAELATKYGTKEEEILKWNHLTEPKSIKGHTLTIYSSNNY
jgi:LysM repeat protein